METKDKKFAIIEKKLSEKFKPIVLELGVNKGKSSEKFLNILNKIDGKLFSVDIRDCSDAINSDKWNFFQSNDLDFKKIINKFPVINDNGIDLIFIDSYHDPTHVIKLLNNWWVYLNKDCLIYFDDTENYYYRLKKNIILSIINDIISSEIKEFYYSNYDEIIYTKYYIGSGLSEFIKLNNKSTPLKNMKIWKYNIFIYYIYKYLKKIIFYLRNN